MYREYKKYGKITKEPFEAQDFRLFLEYDPSLESFLRWKEILPESYFLTYSNYINFQRKHAGKEAGDHNPYAHWRKITIFSRAYSAHRVLYMVVYGVTIYPTDIIYYKDNNRYNHDPANLYLATRKGKMVDGIFVPFFSWADGDQYKK